jgi:hypothetical protein
MAPGSVSDARKFTNDGRKAENFTVIFRPFRRAADRRSTDGVWTSGRGAGQHAI